MSAAIGTLPRVNGLTGKAAYRTIEIGCAGEHIVCADLLLSGVRAFLSAQALPYDVIAEHGGRLIRIAVKSTLSPRPRSQRPGSKENYQFAIGRRRAIKGGFVARAYTEEDADLVALVALDVRKVAYLTIQEAPTVMIFDAPDGRRSTNSYGPKSIVQPNMDEFPFARAAQLFMESPRAQS